MSEAIVKDDMYAADVAKRAVEGAQRKRRNDGASFAPRYFVAERPEFWSFDWSKMKELNDKIATAFDPVPETTETVEKKESETI